MRPILSITILLLTIAACRKPSTPPQPNPLTDSKQSTGSFLDGAYQLKRTQDGSNETTDIVTIKDGTISSAALEILGVKPAPISHTPGNTADNYSATYESPEIGRVTWTWTSLTAKPKPLHNAVATWHKPDGTTVEYVYGKRELGQGTQEASGE